MKLNNLLTAFYTGILAICFALVGCEDMEDTYSEFIKSGETIYIAKADSIKVRGGKGRVEISFLLLSDPKVDRYKIYWNNGRDSVENKVEKTAGVDTVKLMLNDIEEGIHQFEIYTFDKIGNSSVKSIKLGEVYGDLYQSSLLPATYSNLARRGDDLEISWSAASEDLVGIDLNYLDNMNVIREVHIHRNEELTILEDFPTGGEFQFTTAFLPEEQALDTFYTDQSKVKILTDTLNWNPYPVLFGHLGNLIAMEEDGKLMQLDPDSKGGFNWPRQISRGWSIFDALFSNQTGVIARFPDGGLRLYALRADGTFAPTKTIGSGFHIFDPFFAYGDDLMGRKDNGELWIYPLDANGKFGTASTITGTWNQYVQMWGSFSANVVIGLTSDGKLWSIPISGGAAGTAVEIGQGWDRFNLISSFGNDLIAREPDGDLWYYPVEANGTLGASEQIIVVRESF